MHARGHCSLLKLFLLMFQLQLGAISSLWKAWDDDDDDDGMVARLRDTFRATWHTRGWTLKEWFLLLSTPSSTLVHGSWKTSDVLELETCRRTGRKIWKGKNIFFFNTIWCKAITISSSQPTKLDPINNGGSNTSLSNRLMLLFLLDGIRIEPPSPLWILEKAILRKKANGNDLENGSPFWRLLLLFVKVI